VFIKQELWELDPLDRWIDVSKRMAGKHGIPSWGLFKHTPADSAIDTKTPQGGLEVYEFEPKEGTQFWWTREYDAMEDQSRMKGRQIVITDDEGHRKSLAVCVNWGIPETTTYSPKSLRGPDMQRHYSP
jgi:hypothetical protein